MGEILDNPGLYALAMDDPDYEESQQDPIDWFPPNVHTPFYIASRPSSSRSTCRTINFPTSICFNFLFQLQSRKPATGMLKLFSSKGFGHLSMECAIQDTDAEHDWSDTEDDSGDDDNDGNDDGSLLPDGDHGENDSPDPSDDSSSQPPDPVPENPDDPDVPPNSETGSSPTQENPVKLTVTSYMIQTIMI
eukprot:gene9322-16454_t